MTAEAIDQLINGVDINIDGAIHHTHAHSASIFISEPEVSPRYPPVRFRKHIPTTWIRLVIKEGKNRQVRKMTAAVGFATLRLIRYRIADLRLDIMAPGNYIEWTKEDIYPLLGL
jgi:23S rRNA pseudouridine2457 synthase